MGPVASGVRRGSVCAHRANYLEDPEDGPLSRRVEDVPDHRGALPQCRIGVSESVPIRPVVHFVEQLLALEHLHRHLLDDES